MTFVEELSYSNQYTLLQKMKYNIYSLSNFNIFHVSNSLAVNTFQYLYFFQNSKTKFMIPSLHKFIIFIGINCLFIVSGYAQCLTVIPNLTDATCGTADGQVLLEPTNGVAPFEYALPSGTIQINGPYTWTGLSVGDYSIVVTDANGCAGTVDFTINEDTDLSVENFNFLTGCDGNCFDLFINATSSCSSLTYQWTGPNGFNSDQQFPFACEPGTYTATVIDCNGCTASGQVALEIIPTPFISEQNVTNSSCNGCTGTVDIDVAGGTPPYTFQWADGSTTEDLSNVCAGIYVVTIVDVNGCASTSSVLVECTELVVQTTRTHPTCEGVCDGSINATVTGGTPPYTFNWSNGETQQTISNLCAGIYQVTVVDALNAFGTNFQDTLAYDTVLEYDITTTGISCDIGGSIEVNMLNGSGDFSYSLNGVVGMSNVMTNINSISNYVEVTDNVSGCIVGIPVQLTPPFNLDVTGTNASCGMSDGTATATVNNATSTYSYVWSNGEMGATITGLAPGGYSVTATDDDNGCSTHENIYIEEDPVCFVVISGYVIDDTDDLDCSSAMAADSVGLQLISLDDSQFTFTDLDGYYSFQTTPGTHTVKYESQSILYNTLCADPVMLTVDNFGDTLMHHFYVEKNDVIDIRLNIIKNAIRPGFNHTIFADIFNAGNPVLDGQLIFTHDVNQNFISANPAPTSYDPVSRIIMWDMITMEQTSSAFYTMNFTTDATVPIGTQITMGGIINPTVGDINPDNNALSCTAIVTGSYDPNDKAVTHDGIVWEFNPDPNSEIISPGSTENLSYLIRFQNTGTDTAFTVVIEDELDPAFDVRNMTPGSASHDYTLDVRDGNVLVFTFDNILLPDSTTNEPASHGFVLFDIDIPTIDQPYGESILNDAAIFFDFNLPIITNEVNVIFQDWLGTADLASSYNVELKPNPTNEITVLSFDLDESATTTIELLDITGKNVLTIQQNQSLQSGNQDISIDMSDLVNGTYLVKIVIDNRTITKKIVKI